MAAREDISVSHGGSQDTSRLQREVSPDDELVKPVGVSAWFVETLNSF